MAGESYVWISGLLGAGFSLLNAIFVLDGGLEIDGLWLGWLDFAVAYVDLWVCVFGDVEEGDEGCCFLKGVEKGNIWFVLCVAPGW